MTAEAGGARLRAAAARAIDGVVHGGRSLDAELAAVRVAERDRPLLWMICYGVLRQHWRLRATIDALLDRPLKSRDRVIESLLAVGLYQLTDTRVPPHAAVSLTVEAARVLRRPQHAGVVNACLRTFQRRPPEAAGPTTDEVRFNHPAWLIERLREAWPQDWQDILAANDAHAPMWLRVNARVCDTADYLEALGDGSLLSGCDQAIRLSAPRPVAELPGFDRGRVSVQDAAAQLAAPWLLSGGGKRILDACAAPGGKTAHLLELSPPGAVLTAVDVDPDRLEVARANLARLGLPARLVSGDAAVPADWWDGTPFDRILLDAPCSATGVIRRHPDIRLLRRAADIDALAVRQGRLLAALWPLLAPGGRLLYVTCSVLPAENEDIVADFLEAQGDAAEDSLLPNNNIRDVMCRKACGFQILPGRNDLDGFYYACLTKKVQ
jgi:16S rRNA (cytosine967-C5)-methyltransferase